MVVGMVKKKATTAGDDAGVPAGVLGVAIAADVEIPPKRDKVCRILNNLRSSGYIN